MEFEKQINKSLLIRGFNNDYLLNSRGLIGATIDETILRVVKTNGAHNVKKKPITGEYIDAIASEYASKICYSSLSPESYDKIKETMQGCIKKILEEV